MNKIQNLTHNPTMPRPLILCVCTGKSRPWLRDNGIQDWTDTSDTIKQSQGVVGKVHRPEEASESPLEKRERLRLEKHIERSHHRLSSEGNLAYANVYRVEGAYRYAGSKGDGTMQYASDSAKLKAEPVVRRNLETELNRSADAILDHAEWGGKAKEDYNHNMSGHYPPLDKNWKNLNLTAGVENSDEYFQEEQYPSIDHYSGSDQYPDQQGRQYDAHHQQIPNEDPVDAYLRGAAPQKPPRSYADLSSTHWRKLNKLEQENRISKSMGDLNVIEGQIAGQGDGVAQMSQTTGSDTNDLAETQGWLRNRLLCWWLLCW